MEVIRCKKIFKNHSWRKNEDGSVDECAWDSDYHSGVSCVNCNETICTLCEDYTECDTECYISWNECPSCHKEIFPHRGANFCEFCGCKIEYNEKSKEVLINEWGEK